MFIAATTFLLTLLDLPAMGLGLLASLLMDKSLRIAAIPFLLLGRLYTFALMVVWSVVVFAFFMHRADNRTGIPLLIWSYGIATGPWAYMAGRQIRYGDPPALSGAIEVMGLQFGDLLLMFITAGLGVSLGLRHSSSSAASRLSATGLWPEELSNLFCGGKRPHQLTCRPCVRLRAPFLMPALQRPNRGGLGNLDSVLSGFSA